MWTLVSLFAHKLCMLHALACSLACSGVLLLMTSVLLPPLLLLPLLLLQA
jgi:hypothetical protein